MKKASVCCWSEIQTVSGAANCLHCGRVTELVDVCGKCGCGDCGTMDNCDYDPEYDDLYI